MRRGLLLPFVLVAVAPFARAGDEPAPSPWRDQALIARRFDEAIAAVEEACGAKFAKRPTVTVSTPAQVEAILRTEMKEQLGAPGGDAIDLALVSKMLIAKYEPAGHAVHVVPGNVDALSAALKDDGLKDADVLRVILAHECTHALDFERFPLEAARKGRLTHDEMLGYGAVVEGHAQLVAERISAAWGIAKAFETYVRAITAVPPGTEPAIRLAAETMAAEVGFGYVQGLAFLKAVEAARGREGVEAALKSPPRGTREIEHPEWWLDPTKAPVERDLGKALQPVRDAVAKDGTWTFADQRVMDGLLAPMVGMLPEAERPHALDGYEDGHVLVANDLPQRMVQAVLLRFRTPEDAARFLDVERRVQRIKDEQMKEGAVKILESSYEEGAGEGSRRKGFRAAKKIEAMGQSVAVRSAVAAEGRFVLELVVLNAPTFEDAAVAKAVDAVLATP